MAWYWLGLIGLGLFWGATLVALARLIVRGFREERRGCVSTERRVGAYLYPSPERVENVVVRGSAGWRS